MPTDLAAKIISNKSRASVLNGIAAPQASGEKTTRIKLTGDERKRVEEMIKNASSLAEFERLEKMLSEGRVPGGIGE
jgi:U2 small nuclear ribonucleoprotein A'